MSCLIRLRTVIKAPVQAAQRCTHLTQSLTSRNFSASSAPPRRVFLQKAVATSLVLGHNRLGLVLCRAMASAQGSSSDMVQLNGMAVVRIPCLSDNYAWLLINKNTGETAVVDTPEAKNIREYLDDKGLNLDYILNTHHHWDHTGGNEELKKKYKSKVVGPKADRDRIPAIDVALADGDTWQFGDLEMRVLDTPGHTRGHITLYFPTPGAVFTGDTLFAMGCGRLFEGTPSQMWASLSKIAALPPDTQVFCGHEYTASNAKFAASVDPDNPALTARKQAVDALHSQGLATLPCSLKEELETNPFLRPSDPAIRAKLGIPSSASDAEALGVIRQAKDHF